VEVIEQVTGRFGASRTLATFALNGGLIGLFFGLLFSWWGALTPEVHWVWLVFDGMAYGALLAVGLAVLLQALGLRRRNFASSRP
jgi:hypothetical protein